MLMVVPFSTDPELSNRTAFAATDPAPVVAVPFNVKVPALTLRGPVKVVVPPSVRRPVPALVSPTVYDV
jgi:hypothetical protein